MSIVGYLNGAENLAYKEVLCIANVKNVCIDFSYAKRVRRVDWEESLEPFEKVMLIPGYNEPDEVYEYIDFINEYENLFDFVISFPGRYRQVKSQVNVDVVPFYNEAPEEDWLTLTRGDIKYPFRVQKLKKENKSFHALGVFNKYAETFNFGAWVSGQFGYTYQYHNERFIEYDARSRVVRTAIARQLKMQGYPINIGRLLKGDWLEVALINTIAWGRYIDDLEAGCVKRINN